MKDTKRFVNIFNSVLGKKYHKWECWQDMIVIFATMISNSVKRNEKREQMYMERIQRYEREDQMVFCELFDELIELMEDNKQPVFADYLGDMYMHLELGNDAGGQFFTPYNICRMLARMNVCRVDENLVKITDPACGAGATLIAAAERLYELGINYQQQALFVAQEIDFTTALMCYIQLSLYGIAGYVKIGDSLRNPTTTDDKLTDENIWVTPMYYNTNVIRMVDAIRTIKEPVKEVSFEGQQLSMF